MGAHGKPPCDRVAGDSALISIDGGSPKKDAIMKGRSDVITLAGYLKVDSIRPWVIPV